MKNDNGTGPRSFHLGTILSIVGEPLLAPEGIVGVYNILHFMTGERPMTHQLRRVADECKPWLLRQHPQLADVEFPSLSGAEAWLVWLDEQVAKRGEHLSVERIPFEDHARRDPIEEFRQMRPGIPIAGVVLEETSG